MIILIFEKKKQKGKLNYIRSQILYMINLKKHIFYIFKLLRIIYIMLTID